MDWFVMAVATIGAGLLHLAGNLLNDYFDYRSGVDRRVEDDAGRPGRLLVRGELQPRDVLAEAIFCLLLAAIPGVYLTILRGWAMPAFAAAAVLGLYSYTGPPLRLKYHAMGEPLIFLVFGPVLMTAAAWAQVGRFDLPAMLVSIPVGLSTTAILNGNNLRDEDEDATAGISTLTHALGARAGRVLYTLLVLSSAVGAAILAAVGILPKAMLAAPLLLVLLARPLACVWRNRRLPDIDAQTARYVAALLAAMIITLIISRLP